MCWSHVDVLVAVCTGHLSNNSSILFLVFRLQELDVLFGRFLASVNGTNDRKYSFQSGWNFQYNSTLAVFAVEHFLPLNVN